MADPKENVLEQFVQYVTDKGNIWDPEKFLSGRRLNGQAFGKESQLSFQYVLGNAYLTGTIGDLKIQIFYRDLNGFQMYITPPGEPLVVAPEAFHPSRGGGQQLLDAVQDAVNELDEPIAE